MTPSFMFSVTFSRISLRDRAYLVLAKGVLEVCLNGLRVGLVPAGLVGCTVVGDQALGLFIFELVFGPAN